MLSRSTWVPCSFHDTLTPVTSLVKIDLPVPSKVLCKSVFIKGFLHRKLVLELPTHLKIVPCLFLSP